MEMNEIIVRLCSILVVCSGSVAETDINVNQFQTILCNASSYGVILKATSVKNTTRHSLLKCALTCSRNFQCNFAVFRPSTQMCKHVFSYQGNSQTSLPSYINEHGCRVLRKVNKPLCQNGGHFTGNVMCLCPDEFHGWECEESKPSFCSLNSWREVTSADNTTLFESFLQVKMLEQKPSSTKISDVNFFTTDGGSRFQSHNYLSVDGDAFESVLRREYNYYTEASGSGVLWTRKVSMTGDENTQDSTPSVKLLMRDAVDGGRTAYQANVNENLSFLTSMLYLGLRVMMQGPARTDFDLNSGDVVYQRPKFIVGASSTNFLTPIYFFATKTCLKQKMFHITRWYIKTGTHKSSIAQSYNGNVDLDRCWIKMAAKLPQEDTLALLTDVLLSQGKEIRIIMAASIASDVTMVTITDTDVVVILADYLTPSDAFTAFGSSTKIRFSSVSLSRTFSECEMTFQGSSVHQINNDPYPFTLEWVVSSRTWIISLIVTSMGTSVSGSHNDVYSAAVSGLGIRVCVEKAVNISDCFHGIDLNLDDTTKHVTLQSPAVLDMTLNSNRTLSGISSSDCKRKHYLVSTKGWVKQASFVIGLPDPVDAIQSVNFLKVTWFQEK